MITILNFLSNYLKRSASEIKVINQQNYNICKATLPPMSTKIDKMRRKLQQNKKKAILQNLKVNQNLSSLLFRTKTHLAEPISKNHLSFLPSSSLCNTHELSTDHSEQQNGLSHSHTLPISSEFRRMQHSVQTEKASPNWYRQVELTTKTLNPTLKINWNSNINNRTVTERQNIRNIFINTQTPSTVIIVADTQAALDRAKVKKSFRSVIKRHSILQRKTYTPQEDQSPTKRYEISAWQTNNEQ